MSPIPEFTTAKIKYGINIVKSQPMENQENRPDSA
jgi:hypothetical protein